MSFSDHAGLAHHRSPGTSWAAAVALVNSGAKRRDVFMAIARTLEKGITADRLEVVTGMDGNTVRPRVRELIDAGLVEYGDRREKTRKGRLAQALILTDEGVDLALTMDDL